MSFLDRLKSAFADFATGWGASAEGATLPASTSLEPALLASLVNGLPRRYRLEREVGSGGMAVVFQAVDAKHDRPVAIKVLRPDLASHLGRERFLREIRLAARLTHPHILPLHDSGEAAGLLFYVMPFVEGTSLRERLRSGGRLPIGEALEIGRAVAMAVDYAHRQGVVHRDIKPENIMMHDGVAVVTDFGIGKALSVAGPVNLTQAGMAIGTPAYMSPEQMYGEEELDGRSDLYSLALVIAEMLNGEPVFSGPTPRAVLASRAGAGAPDIAFPADMPDAVTDAIRAALAEDRASRPASGAQFAATLAGALHSPGPGTTAPAQVRARDADPSIAVLPFANLSGDPESEYFSDGVTEEVINALTRLGGLRVAARTSSFAFKGQSLSVTKVGSRLGVDSVLEGSVRQAGDRLRVTAQLVSTHDGYHLWSERWDRELDDVFRVQDEIAAGIADRLKVTLTTGEGPVPQRPATTNLDAYQLYLKGRYLWNRRTDAALHQAVEYFEQAIVLDPNYALAYSGLADAYLLMGSYRMVPRGHAMQKAQEAAEQALALDESLAEAHTSRGQVLRNSRDWDAEAAAYQRAIALNPSYATAHHWYATNLAIRGRMDEALKEIRRAEELDPLSHAISVTVALILYLARDLEGAARQLRRTFELEPEFFSAIAYAGLIFAEQGLREEALRQNDRMAEQSRGQVVGEVLAHRASIHGLLGEETEARRLLAEAKEADADPGHVAHVHAELGDVDEAFAWLDKALEVNSWWLFYLKVIPALDPIRSDPRFRTYLARLGLD